MIIGQQRKKKSAIKNKPRPVSVSVVMLEKFTTVIPKGKFRKQLISRGQIQTMRVTREMNHEEVHTKILKAFEISKYTVLESNGTGHGLLKASEQNIDGSYVAERRGCLYMCQSFEVSCVLSLSTTLFLTNHILLQGVCSKVPTEKSSKLSVQVLLWIAAWCMLCHSICVG